MSDFRREILMEHRDRLLDKMTALRNQVGGLDIAIAILANDAASVDTLPKGQDAQQGLAGTEGSAVGAAETP